MHHPIDADAGDGRPRIEDSRVRRERVPQRVAEAGLEGLEHEPRTVIGDDLFGQGRALCDEHCCFLSVGIRYLTPGLGGAGRLLGVELDDELLLDLRVDLLAGRQRVDQDPHLLRDDLDPCR